MFGIKSKIGKAILTVFLSSFCLEHNVSPYYRID